MTYAKMMKEIIFTGNETSFFKRILKMQIKVSKIVIFL